MENKIADFIKEKEVLTTELKKWVKDKSIPLKTRWDTFISSGLGNEYGCIMNFHPVVEQYIKGDWMNRYQTIEIDTVEEDYSENVYSDMQDGDYRKEVDHEAWTKRVDKELAEFREAALKIFIKSFELDW